MEDSKEEINTNLTITSLVEDNRRLKEQNIVLKAQLDLMERLFDKYVSKY